MAEIDRIILRFELHGAEHAQALIGTLSRYLMELRLANTGTGKSALYLGNAVGFGAKNIQVMGNYTSDTILKVSEFAVVIFALVGAYKALIAPIVDVNKNMKIVQSVSHATNTELKALEDEAIRLGTIFPGGAKRATEALVAIGQAGYDTRQSLQLMEPVFKLATIGDIEFSQSIELIISVLNAFNRDTSEASKTVDTLAASISHTLTTVETFSIALPALSSLANDLGINFEEVVALLGYLRDRGIPASRTATALKNVFTELTRETAGLSKKLQGTGLTVEDFDIKSRGLKAVLETVAGASLSTAQKIDLLGLRGIYAGSIVDEEVTASLWEMVKALEESGESTFQSGVILTATASKWAQLGATIQASIISIFRDMLPLMDSIINGLKFLASALGNLSPETRALIRWVTGLIVAFTALSVWLKALKLLFVDFLYGRGVLGGIQIVKQMAGALLYLLVPAARSTAIAFLGLKSAAEVTWGAILGPIGAVAVFVASFLGMKYAMDKFKESVEGQMEVTQSNIDQVQTQRQELIGLKKRLIEAADEYKKFTKEGKDSKKSLAEFYNVLVDVTEKFPEMSRFTLGLAQDFGNMEFAVDGVNTVLVTLNNKLEELIITMAKLRKLKFIEEIGKLVPGALAPSKIVPHPQTGIPIDVGGWLSSYLQELFPFPTTPGTTGFKFRKIRPLTPEEIFETLIGLNPAQIEELGKRALAAGVEPEAVLKLQSAIVQQSIAGLIDAIEDVDKGGGGGVTPGGGAGRDRFEVPGLRAFRALINRIRARQEFLTSEAELTLTRAGATDLAIQKQINEQQQRQVKWQQNIYDLYLKELQAVRSRYTSMTQTEEVIERLRKIDDELLRIQIERIGLDVKQNDLLTERYQIGQKIVEQFFKRAQDTVKQWREFIKLAGEAYDTINRQLEVERELRDIRQSGLATGKERKDILEDQLSYINNQIESLLRVMNNLRKLFGWMGDEVLNFLRNMGNRIMLFLQGLRTELETAIEDIERAEEQREIYEETRESVESAIADALVSGDVKGAIEDFANLIKEAVAKKLAEQIADSLTWFIGGLSEIRGGAGAPTGGPTTTRRPSGRNLTVQQAGATAGAAAGAAGQSGAASTLGWIGVALMAVSLIGSIFGRGKGIDELNTKLDYIIRGAGYQLPPSFLLPEDEGEFAFRRRGRESFAIRFPKRNLDIQITHRFEWNPGELARAVGSDMTVGGMGGAKQYSLIGGE